MQQEMSFSEDISEISADTEDETSDAQIKDTVMIYICGAVNAPGVYELNAGSRICDAVEMAGGLLPDADEKALNQAQVLSDEQQITVYTLEETESAVSETGVFYDGGGRGASSKININKAGKELLMTLPGIGETRADEILAYREANGGFTEISEICSISGIGEKTFEKLKDFIEV